MKRYIALAILALPCSLLNAQQLLQLMWETFNGSTHQFTPNASGPGGSTGVNTWIVNSEYNGAPSYPNTVNQDSTVAGSIVGAPFSKYLHIHDNASAQKNANWNNGSTSSSFAHMTSGICTKALTDVSISFFWLCEGNPDAFGEVYYSINNGPWLKAGQAKYNNQDRWDWEHLQNSAWDDKEDVRFGFRWVNAGGGTSNTSFAIDDVKVMGTFDDVNNPVTINITNVTPNPVCRDASLIAFYAMSDTFCYGSYRFELSDSICDFSNPVNLGFITVNQYTVSGAVMVNIPQVIPAGACYCLRMVRQSPQPVVAGNPSGCFEVIDCPRVITTHQPAVTNGSGNGQGDSACVYSVVDVPFNSTGVFNPNNIYTAQLSDANGNFDTLPAPFLVGQSPDPNNYPATPRGIVRGIMPTVPPGCGYNIRVVASSPPTIGSPWGPFCIKECDILTNNIQDINLCINETDGDSALICYDIHTWTNSQQYLTGNQFVVELHNEDMAIVNVGGLGLTLDTTSGCLTVYAPPLPQLIAMGLSPKTYYMRIIATNGSLSYDLHGSLVRLTIGAPSAFPPAILNPDTLICSGAISCFTVAPYNPQSLYEWQTPQIGFPQSGSTVCQTSQGFEGTFTIRVREINNGCYGPWSSYAELTVLGKPNVSITGPFNTTAGYNTEYSVPFETHSTYSWQSAFGSFVDPTSHIVLVSWPQPGVYTLTVNAFNACDSASSSKTVTVDSSVGQNPIAVVPQLHIYPNPAKDQLILRVSDYNKDMKLVLTDAVGREIKSWQLDGSEGEWVIDVSGVAAGIYSLSAVADGTRMASRGVVIMK